jgi:hypothetical protein
MPEIGPDAAAEPAAAVRGTVSGIVPRRWALIGGGAALTALPAAPVTVLMIGGNLGIAIAVASVFALAAIVMGITAMYQAYQETRRAAEETKRLTIEKHADNAVADAIAAAINATHVGAFDDAGRMTAEEASQVRASAQQFLAQHSDGAGFAGTLHDFVGERRIDESSASTPTVSDSAGSSCSVSRRHTYNSSRDPARPALGDRR